MANYVTKSPTPRLLLVGPAPYHGRHTSVTSGFCSRVTAFEHGVELFLA